MNDLIKITEEEHAQLSAILPENIRSVQIYREPALEAFCLEETMRSIGMTARYTFWHGINAMEQAPEIQATKESFDTSTVVVCRIEMISFDGETEKSSFVFGYSSQKLLVVMPKTKFWLFVQSRGDMHSFTNEIVHMYESVQYLLLHHKELLQFSITSKPNKHSAKKKGGKAKKGPPTKTRLYRFVHMSDEEVEKFKKTARAEHEKRNMERHCAAWGVRGHYRHYKSGKVAYIKPHVRGKEKEKYTGREYALFPKNVT